MKFLLFSQAGEGAQILHQIKMEGNEVGIYINDPLYSTVFDGLLPKIAKPDGFIDKDTIIIFDLSGNGKIADKYKKAGHFVYGASEFADRLEHDRQFGFDAMIKAGIEIPEHKEFTDFKLGREYVRESNKRLVFKPSGSMPCKLTYCSKDAQELDAYMSFVEKHFGKDIESFILQDFIEGIVVSSEFFCNGKAFLEPSNHTVEVKKSMNDDLGPSTGCSGNTTWICHADEIIQKGVGKIQDLCVQNEYVGQIDLNAVVNEEGVYGLEWTPRFGYDATPTLLTLLNTDFGRFFSDMARSEAKSLDFDAAFASGVRVTIPPYPAEPKEGIDPEKFSPNMGVPIQGCDEFEEDLYFYEVCLGEEGLAHSGGTGVIACAMGVGNTPERSLEYPYEVLKAISVPDKQYRTDLNKVLPKMVKEVNQYA